MFFLEKKSKEEEREGGWYHAFGTLSPGRGYGTVGFHMPPKNNFRILHSRRMGVSQIENAIALLELMEKSSFCSPPDVPVNVSPETKLPV